MANKAGRPTDYNEKILEDTQDYVDNYVKYGDVVPSIAGLAVHLYISRTTIYDWASQEEKKEFSYMLQDILSKQEKVLVSNGLTNKFNSTITKLMLAKHGYVEKQELDIKESNKLTDAELKSIISESVRSSTGTDKEKEGGEV